MTRKGWPSIVALVALLGGLVAGYFMGAVRERRWADEQIRAEVSARKQNYYQSAYDTCLSLVVYVYHMPMPVALGACLGYVRGEYVRHYFEQLPSYGWNWEFVSDAGE